MYNKLKNVTGFLHSRVSCVGFELTIVYCCCAGNRLLVISAQSRASVYYKTHRFQLKAQE